MITKTDFLQYLEAPMHLWAGKHGQLSMAPSPFDLHQMEQGKEVEVLGQEFLEQYIAAQGADSKPTRQRTFVDGDFQARVDAVVQDPSQNAFDLYEIKSGTSVDKQDKYDAAFQRLICEANIPVRDLFVVHVNKEYVRSGSVDVGELFVVANMNDDVEALRGEVTALREEALKVAESDTANNIPACLKPNDCRCLELCHPELPQYPIYEVPRLNREKTVQLRRRGVLAIQDIPDDFPLSSHQQIQVSVVKSGKPEIHRSAIRAELERLEFPLYFLDYETCNPAVPWYDGYRPYQHIVFQYSLHVLAAPGAAPEHHEFLDTDEGDPSTRLVGELGKHIGQRGSVVVWNKPFEAGRNTEMAARYPEYRDILENINARIFDLMEIFSKGLLVHPDFHGSASLKKVLPVLTQGEDLNYAALPIGQGDEAMLAWKAIVSGATLQEDVPATRANLLRYCELDTLAMIKCWEAVEDQV